MPPATVRASVRATVRATVSAEQARTLLLLGQDLLADPGRKPTPARLRKSIAQQGFVQLDSICVVERAHHLTLGARFRDYRPAHLQPLRKQRALFEHWTHDASLLPIEWYPHWKRRFLRFQESARSERFRKRRLGDDPDKLLRRVLSRVRREGPLFARDFDEPRSAPGGWWNWKPAKSALEFLWTAGRLGVAEREHFHKRYDLPTRLFPDAHAERAATPRAHIDWACTSALERLGAATPKEIAHFWDLIPLRDAREWCARAVKRGAVEAVQLASVEGAAPVAGIALPDWRERAARAPAPPAEMRLLAPFDPILRDRDRAHRLFGFEYRFEAFVPAPKRRYGYYVLPVLEGDRLVARLDPKLHREEGRLEVRAIHFEKGLESAARRARLEEALAALAARVGAREIQIPGRKAR